MYVLLHNTFELFINSSSNSKYVIQPHMYINIHIYMYSRSMIVIYIHMYYTKYISTGNNKFKMLAICTNRMKNWCGWLIRTSDVDKIWF